MPALTPRRISQSVKKSYLGRTEGASYGYDIMLDSKSPNFEHVMGAGLASFGGSMSASGLTSFGSGGLYPFGSGLTTYGNGLYPFGMGIFDKVKGLARNLASAITGTRVGSLRRLALDMGKKGIKAAAPHIIAKAKQEIAKQAPGLAVRLTDPLVGKLPMGLQSHAKSAIMAGEKKALSGIEAGLNKVGSRVQTLAGNGLYLTPDSESANLSDKQLAFMGQRGMADISGRQSGELSKRLVMDEHSRSLADTILANEGYKRAKQGQLLQEVGVVKPKGRSIGGAKAGRPKGSSMRKKLTGMGVVYK